VVAVQEFAGLIGDANYRKHELEFQAYKRLLWDTVGEVFEFGVSSPGSSVTDVYMYICFPNSVGSLFIQCLAMGVFCFVS